MRHGLTLGGIALGRGDHSTSKGPVEDHVAGRPRGIGETIRPPCFRRLRQGHKQRRLADREPLRFAAEIGKARRTQALNIAAIRGKPQVKIEDASLAYPPFDLYRAQNLTELSGKRFSGARLAQPRHLHRQSRAARNDMAVACPLQRGATEAERINA